jgi:hypothetical protein
MAKITRRRFLQGAVSLPVAGVIAKGKPSPSPSPSTDPAFILRGSRLRGTA